MTITPSHPDPVGRHRGRRCRCHLHRRPDQPPAAERDVHPDHRRLRPRLAEGADGRPGPGRDHRHVPEPGPQERAPRTRRLRGVRRRLPRHHVRRPSPPPTCCRRSPHSNPGFVNDAIAVNTGRGTVHGDIGAFATAIKVARLRLPGRRPALRHRAVPRPRAAPLGRRTARRRRRRHGRPRGDAGRLLPTARLPQRHRHDRPRLLAVAGRPCRHRRRCRPRWTPV